MKHQVQASDGAGFQVVAFRGRVVDMRQRVEHDLHEGTTATFLPGGTPVKLPSYSMSATHLQKVRVAFDDGEKLSIELPGDCDASIGDEVSVLVDDENFIVGWVNHETRSSWGLAEQARVERLAPLLNPSNPVLKGVAAAVMFGWRLFGIHPVLGTGYFLGVPVLLLNVFGSLDSRNPLGTPLLLIGCAISICFLVMVFQPSKRSRRRFNDIQQRLREIGQTVAVTPAGSGAPVAATAAP